MSSLRSSHRLLWHGVKRIRTLTCISNSFVSSVSLSTRRCFYASPAVEAQSDNNSNGNDSHRDSDLAPFTTVRVSKDCEGMRLDAFIRHSYPWLNANFMHSLIRKRRIGLARTDLPPQKWVRSRPMRTDCRDPLQEGEVVVVPRSITHPPATDDPNETRTQIHTRGNESERARLYARKLGNDTTKVEELKGMASSIPVIFQDEHILVVNKPGGLAVQSGASARPDIVKLLPFLQFEADVIPRLVHRLDRVRILFLLMMELMRASLDLYYLLFCFHLVCLRFLNLFVFFASLSNLLLLLFLVPLAISLISSYASFRRLHPLCVLVPFYRLPCHPHLQEVSGLLMLARSRKAASLLGSMLRKKTISKGRNNLSDHCFPCRQRTPHQ